MEENESLSVGEYIFETFYEPIDDKSYDSENDCDTDKQHKFLRKNEHRKPPFQNYDKANICNFCCQQNLVRFLKGTEISDYTD